ncbi:MAG: hypothetical protein PHE25_05095 [Candidatus Gracilibacteria bacterium]|nr:hypothetical protein [Candidatus Gracilibacteria bacterium]
MKINNKNLLSVFKLSILLFNKNKKRNIFLIIIFLIIFILNFLILALYIESKSILNKNFNSISDIIIKSEIKNNKDILSFNTLKQLNNSIGVIGNVSYSYVLKIPIYSEINFLNIKKVDTDLFIMSYDFDILKNSNSYKKISYNHDKEDIGIILSTKIISLLNNFIIKGININTLEYINGELFFGKYSYFSNANNIVKKKFYIDGVSDELPIYAIAIDHKLSNEIISQLGININDFKLYEISIKINDLSNYNKIINIINNISGKLGTSFVYYNSNEEVNNIKKYYNKIINFIGIPILLFFCILLNILFIGNLLISIERNTNNIKIFRYLRYKNSYISFIFFLEFQIIFISGLLLFLFILIINIYNLDKILYYISNMFGIFPKLDFSKLIIIFIFENIFLMIILYLLSYIVIKNKIKYI